MESKERLLSLTRRMATGIDFRARGGRASVIRIVDTYAKGTIGNVPERRHIKQCLESIEEKVKDTSIADIASRMERKGESVPTKGITSALVDHLQAIKDYTYTYRLLADLVRIQAEWNLSFKDRFRLVMLSWSVRK